MNLCYSTFLKLIQEHYVYDITGNELASYIIEQLTPESEYSKYTKTYLNSFWNRERNITSNLKENITKEPYKSKCEDHFKNVIAKQIHESSEDDFCQKLSNLISNDDTIPSKKKSSLHHLYEEGNKGKYLFHVFSYALTKQNKDSVKQLSTDDIYLVSEVDQRCPLCSNHTYFFTNGLARYTVVRIYPEFLDADLKTSFDSIKPSQVILMKKQIRFAYAMIVHRITSLSLQQRYTINY